MVLWQQRRWFTLLNLIDHIPGSSYFGEAQADDDDLAAAWLAHEQPDKAPPPRLSQWDPIRAELAVIADRIAELISLTASAHGGNQIRVEPRPRPQTAVDRLRTAKRLATHNSLVERFLPNRTD